MTSTTAPMQDMLAQHSLFFPSSLDLPSQADMLLPVASPPSPSLHHQHVSMTATSSTPSKVIYFRNVVPDITQADLLNLCAPFGRVTHILLLKNSQALVQFADLAAATSFVKYYGGHMQKKPISLVALEDVDEVSSSQEENSATNITQHIVDDNEEEQDGMFLGNTKTTTAHHQAVIRGIPVYPNFSSHQELAKGALNGASVCISIIYNVVRTMRKKIESCLPPYTMCNT